MQISDFTALIGTFTRYVVLATNEINESMRMMIMKIAINLTS